MGNYFVITILVTGLTWILYIPFINLLYKLKMQKDSEKGRLGILGKQTTKFQKLHAHKKGTPIGGGILVVIVTSVVFYMLSKTTHNLDSSKINILLVTFIIFGLFGFYDDLRKIIPNKTAQILHIKASNQLVIQLGLSGFITALIMQTQTLIISVPGLAEISNKGLVFIVTVLTIVFVANAYNITDGLDGLGSGSLLVTLTALGTIFATRALTTELLFISILFGAALAYLYFNINPARLFNGDSGTFAIGSVLALLLILNNLIYLIPFIYFIYIGDALTSLVQGFSKKFRKKSIFEIAPIHHHFEMIGWPETKVTMRFWLINAYAALTSLAVYFYLNPRN